ncbi:hypothetical protein GCM10017581_074040 [Dactylosporangium matsuzakiense]|uniref:Uncharacterized protein n=1 Tax=Dactylosporangium matsuzakiense TaxID=53360 RepID=A0A9W6KPB1_9ACTN|nr:hypothetical protein GCM10017581_074040 [Dactylosporangium matsuzakiense]
MRECPVPVTRRWAGRTCSYDWPVMYRPWLLRALPRHRRIMRGGATAEAIVLESRPWGWTSGAVRPNNRLTLRVHFHDGTTTTIARVERTHYLLQDESVGSTLPMRYDPADRAYIDIDRRALLDRHARFEREADRARIEDAERRRRHPGD